MRSAFSPIAFPTCSICAAPVLLSTPPVRPRWSHCTTLAKRYAAGQIASAIVGGVNLLLTPYPFLGFCRASMLSRRGRCFAFDERADGYVRGEGGAVVIIKPLADALADRDPIRALVLATGCNSDGRTIGLSLPSAAAQESLLASVYRNCGVAADELAFFEMHGTGTPAGDPVEASAVGHTLGSTRQEPLPIGSVKTNIGHLEAASGMAGLLKAALALEHGVVPPTLHCETPNPNIDFAGLNLRLVRVAEPIAEAKRRHRRGEFVWVWRDQCACRACRGAATPSARQCAANATAADLCCHRGVVASIGR